MIDRAALDVLVTSVGRSGRHLSGQRGRRHLAARHPINGVVDENDCHVLAARADVDGLRRADRSIPSMDG